MRGIPGEVPASPAIIKTTRIMKIKGLMPVVVGLDGKTILREMSFRGKKLPSALAGEQFTQTGFLFWFRFVTW